MRKINKFVKFLKLMTIKLIRKYFIFKKSLWLIVFIVTISLGGLLILLATFSEVSNFQPKHNTRDTLRVDSEELIGLTMKVPGPRQGEYWELNCTKMVNLNKTGILSSINGRYFSVQKPIYQITAQSGIIDWEKSNLKFYGGVKFSIDNGTELVAQEVTCNPKTKFMEAKGNIVLKNSSLEVKTDYITTDFSLNKVLFKGMTIVSFKNPRGEK
jgi:hypothetical protein